MQPCEARYEGSVAQSFVIQLQALDFSNQIILLGAGLLISLLPFLILLSAFASERVDDDIALKLGLDRRASGIVSHRARAGRAGCYSLPPDRLADPRPRLGAAAGAATPHKTWSHPCRVPRLLAAPG